MNLPFWTAAAALVALAWSMLWVGQRRARARPGAGRTNVALLDEQVAALDHEHAMGSLDAAEHRAAVLEVQRRVLDESSPARLAGRPETASRRVLAALALALPAFAAGGYLALGNPAALQPAAPAAAAANDEVSPDEMRRMVDSLAQQLQARPPGQAEDLQGWVMLARSQAALQRFPEAAAAYERAVALAPDDAQLLADLADVLSVMQAPGATPSGASERVGQLIERAIALDPRNLKALALAGNAAFGRREVSAAIDFWQRARALAPAGSDFAKGLDQNLAEAGAGPGVAANDAPDAVATAAPAAAAATGRALVGEVRIAPALANRVGPGDTLFIFARAENGPRMPLAIVRRPAADLASPFTLDDSSAMSPELRLSKFGAVVVGARISKSGNAMPQPGDLVGEASAGAGSGRLSVVIDRVQP